MARRHPSHNGASRSEREAADSEIEVVQQRREDLSNRLDFLRGELLRLLGRIEFRPKPAREPALPAESLVAEAPPVAPEASEAQRLILSIDEELLRIDGLLAELAVREREIRSVGFAEVGDPHRSAEFTLFVREAARRGKKTRVKYFFSVDAPHDAVPVPLPEGVELSKDARTGRRHLVAKKTKQE